MELQDEFYSNAEYIETVSVVKFYVNNTVRIISFSKTTEWVPYRIPEKTKTDSECQTTSIFS